MKSFTFLLFFLSLSMSNSSWSIDSIKEEKTCAEIGFKTKTKAFAECVVELLMRKRSITDHTKSQSVAHASNNLENATCIKYGFITGTEPHSKCLMQIDLARKEAVERRELYELQMRAYEAQQCAETKERERKGGDAMLEYGLRLLAGQSPIKAATSLGSSKRIIPPSPPLTNKTYVLPEGKVMNCTTTSTTTICF